MQRHSLVRFGPAFAMAFALLPLMLAAGPTPAAAQDFDAAGEAQMLARINQMRASQNLAPLARNGSLDAAARSHCSDMAAQQQLTHVSESSGTPADRVRSAGVNASTVAENVALHRSADQAHAALLASDAHRSNMLSPDVTHAGLAALTSPQGVYVTQVFAALSAPPPAPPLARSVVEPPPAPAAPAPEADDAEAVATPSVAAPTLEGAPAPSAAPQGHLEVQAGSGGTVVIQRVAPGDAITAYWVYGSGRWWYYPMPAGAQPGQQLVVDRSVTGPPPGFPAHPGHPGGAMPQAHAYPAPAPPARGPVGSAIPVPPRGGTIVIDPFRGQIGVAPQGNFYAVPPPPMTGPPTRAYRRQHQRWLRQYRRWLRQQGSARPL